MPYTGIFQPLNELERFSRSHDCPAKNNGLVNHDWKSKVIDVVNQACTDRILQAIHKELDNIQLKNPKPSAGFTDNEFSPEFQDRLKQCKKSRITAQIDEIVNPFIVPLLSIVRTLILGTPTKTKNQNNLSIDDEDLWASVTKVLDFIDRVIYYNEDFNSDPKIEPQLRQQVENKVSDILLADSEPQNFASQISEYIESKVGHLEENTIKVDSIFSTRVFIANLKRLISGKNGSKNDIKGLYLRIIDKLMGGNTVDHTNTEFCCLLERSEKLMERIAQLFSKNIDDWVSESENSLLNYEKPCSRKKTKFNEKDLDTETSQSNFSSAIKNNLKSVLEMVLDYFDFAFYNKIINRLSCSNLQNKLKNLKDYALYCLNKKSSTERDVSPFVSPSITLAKYLEMKANQNETRNERLAPVQQERMNKTYERAENARNNGKPMPKVGRRTSGK